MAVRSVDTTSPPRARVPLRRYVDVLVTYLRPQKALVAVVAVTLLGNIGLQLVNPQLLRYFIDEAQGGSPVSRLIAVAVLFTGVAIVQQLVNVVAVYTSGRVGWTATNALRGDLARQRELLEEAGVEIEVVAQVGLVNLRHTTAKPKDYPYLYPDFLWPVFVASFVRGRPDVKVVDDYEVSSQFLPLEEVRALELDHEKAFLEAAVDAMRPDDRGQA